MTAQEFFTRVWEMLIGRVDGPFTFRLLVPPMVAAIFAIRAGLRDARENRPPYLWSIFTNPATGSGPPARVVLEICTEAFKLAGVAERHGHEVRVVAATLVRALGVGQRGLKNDERDARTLSEASCRIDLLSVHTPNVASQEVKAMCVSREALVPGVRAGVLDRQGTVMSKVPS